MTEEDLQEEFKKYKITVIRDFVTHFMPMPVSGQYQFFKIKSSDDFVYHVWGEDADTILYQFNRFLNLRIFV